VQVIAVGGGMLLSTLVVNATFAELADSFFVLASPMDIVYSLLKSLVSGVAIAIISCYHGLHPPGISINAIPKAAISALTQSTLVVMLLNVVFAYLVFGVLLFGLVTAKL
jgi:ABC-type transporter Mla maintaining outer membrane lipid asymmetry permease subunit MlaE